MPKPHKIFRAPSAYEERLAAADADTLVNVMNGLQVAMREIIAELGALIDRYQRVETELEQRSTHEQGNAETGKRRNVETQKPENEETGTVGQIRNPQSAIRNGEGPDPDVPDA